MNEQRPKLIDDRYAYIKHLDQGGFGSVYLVTDTRTGERVALKFLQRGDADALERFRREARLLDVQKGNPHVVRLHGYNIDHVPPYIAMEFCEGGSLRAWVSKRRSWKEVTAALIHALLGLHAIHEAGGFHRDLKPDNLLLGVNPTVVGGLIVKVGDWGLARAPGSQSPMTHHAAGTQGYVAPEIISGAAYDARADIFSLGVVASELLTGNLTGQLLASIAIPHQLRAIVRQMLSVVPDARPTARRIAQALEVLITTENVAAEVEPTPAADDGIPVAAFVVGGLLVGGVIAALAALAAGDVATPPARAGAVPKPKL